MSANENGLDALLAQAHAAVEALRALGADEARVGVSRSRGVNVEWRDGQLERVQERTRRSLGVEVFVDGRYSASGTNDLRPEALQSFFAEAVSNTRFLEPDPHRRLPDPARYADRAEVDLDLADASQATVTPEARRAEAAALEARVREVAGDLPIVSVSSSVSDGFGQSARVHSNGFEGARESTHFSRSTSIAVKEPDGRRPTGWAYTARRHRSDLQSIESVADLAVQRTQALLGAGKLPTGRYTVVVENRAVRRLIGAFLGPLSGPALQQKRSLWDGRLGDRIASDLLSIYDDPLRVRGMGSGLWDSDGFAAHRRPIIEKGVLKTYLIDDYYARKMGVEPTGGDTFNFDWALGDKDLAGLIAEVGDGVLIDRFLGGNSNGTTGDLSLGCGGRVIRDGKLAEPVAEVNLAGHFGELWAHLIAVGADPEPDSSASCPSCVFADVQLSGV